MYKGRVRLLLALLLSVMLSACGGGGGGGGTTVGETRSVNAVNNNVETSVGSRFAKNVKLNWVGDTTGNVYGMAKINSFSKTAGTGDLTKNADGSLTLINDLAVDTFKFTFGTTHLDDPTDPQRLQPATGAATINITPETPRVIPPTGSVVIPQDGTLALVAQAQNGRGTGTYKIEYIPVPSVVTRAFVTAPATWTVTPSGAVTFTNNADGSVTVRAAAGFTGNARVTATLKGSTVSASTDVTIVPHPSVAISSPTENATVSGVVTVTFATQNANSVSYAIDNGTATNVSGTSFTLNTTTLSNASHTITMKAVGQLETATLQRTIKVSNIIGGGDKKGDVSIDATPISTNQDGKSYINAARYVFKDGGAVSVSLDGVLRFWNPNGTLTATKIDLNDVIYTFTVDKLERIWIPSDNKQVTLVYDRNGALLKTLNTGHMNKARYCSQTDQVLICGPAGLISFDSAYSRTTVLSSYVYSACANNKYYFYQDGNKQLNRRSLTSTQGQASEKIGTLAGILYDMHTVPGYDLVIGTNRGDDSIFRCTTNGSTSSFAHLKMPNNHAVNGIGIDMRDSTGRTVSFAPNPDPSIYIGHVIDKP